MSKKSVFLARKRCIGKNQKMGLKMQMHNDHEHSLLMCRGMAVLLVPPPRSSWLEKKEKRGLKRANVGAPV